MGHPRCGAEAKYAELTDFGGGVVLLVTMEIEINVRDQWLFHVCICVG